MIYIRGGQTRGQWDPHSLFVYDKEPHNYVITCYMQGWPDWMPIGTAFSFSCMLKIHTLCNYGRSESRIQDVKELHVARERRFGHVWYWEYVIYARRQDSKNISEECRRVLFSCKEIMEQHNAMKQFKIYTNQSLSE